MAFLNDRYPRLNEKVGVVRRTLAQYWHLGSARAWARLVAYPFRALGPCRPPFFIDVAPTYRCQCRCVHCSASGHLRNGEELTTDEIKDLLNEAARMGVLQAIFSGGEPLLRDDISELVRHAYDHGLLTRLNTNGLLLSRDRVRELKRAGLALCGLSIDHPDAHGHDRLRNLSGVYARAMEAIENLREGGVLCQFQVYVSRQTAGKAIREIIALARRAKVFSVFVFFVIAAGRYETAFDQLLTKEQEDDLRSLQDAGFVNVELATEQTPCCGLKRNLAYISASGNVTICPTVPFPMGNIRNGGFEKFWRRRVTAADPEYRGRCPMNVLEDRQVLREHARSVAGPPG